MIDDDQRTNPLGLFNYARSYWRSANYLAEAELKLTHPNAPVSFLFFHAIELYLKAFLKASGETLQSLKKIGHSVSKCYLAAEVKGLTVNAETRELLKLIDDTDSAIQSRYIVTGFSHRPTEEALSAATAHLDRVVGAALRNHGILAREEHFSSNSRTSKQSSGAEIVEEWIDTFDDKEKEILSYLLHRNQRMFTAAQDGGHAVTLISKGIVKISVVPGQIVDAEDVPMQIPKDIWEALKQKLDEFPNNPKHNRNGMEPHPWRIHWMAR